MPKRHALPEQGQSSYLRRFDRSSLWGRPHAAITVQRTLRTRHSWALAGEAQEFY